MTKTSTTQPAQTQRSDPFQPLLAPWLSPALQQLQQSSSHAVLLHGASGLGQFALSMALARAWLCETPDRPDNATACGHCTGCTLFAAGNHPDFQLLMPDSTRQQYGLPLKDSKKKKPSKMILTEDMRSALENTIATSLRGGMQVVVIYPAQHLNLVSASNLLKTLEEPVGQVRFILATEKPQSLLPTIRSRCTQFALPWPQPQEALQWLQQHLSSGQPDIALMAHGGRACAVLEQPDKLDDSDWLSLPQRISRGLSGGNTATSLPALIDTIQKVCHDWYCIYFRSPTRYFPASSFDFARQPPALKNLQALSCLLTQAATTAEHPWNTDLAVHHLLTQTRHYLHS